MEIAKMNYYFTGLLILALTMLALLVEPAYPKNEYLNEYGVRCGEFETRVEAEDGIRDLRMSRGLGDVYKRQPFQVVDTIS